MDFAEQGAYLVAHSVRWVASEHTKWYIPFLDDRCQDG
jgi:hypothetical protein